MASAPQPSAELTTSLVQAEDQYANGMFAAATGSFALAYNTVMRTDPPDLLAASRAARGIGVSMFRCNISGPDIWFDKAEGHQNTVLEAAMSAGDVNGVYQARRELVQTGSVIGEVLLGRCVRALGRGREADPLTRSEALRRLRGAWTDLDEVEGMAVSLGGKPGVPDQYRINAASRVSVAELLLPDGDRREGKKIARQAWDLAWRSESPALPTAANRGRIRRCKAVGRALVRGAAARTVSHMVRSSHHAPPRLAYKVAKLAI